MKMLHENLDKFTLERLELIFEKLITELRLLKNVNIIVKTLEFIRVRLEML